MHSEVLKARKAIKPLVWFPICPNFPHFSNFPILTFLSNCVRFNRGRKVKKVVDKIATLIYCNAGNAIFEKHGKFLGTLVLIFVLALCFLFFLYQRPFLQFLLRKYCKVHFPKRNPKKQKRQIKQENNLPQKRDMELSLNLESPINAESSLLATLYDFDVEFIEKFVDVPGFSWIHTENPNSKVFRRGLKEENRGG